MTRPTGTILSTKTSTSLTAVVATSLVTALAVSDVAVASAGAGHHPSIHDIIPFWVNFVIYIALMTALLRKPIKNGWASRRNRIAEEVASATSEMEAAERELAAVEALTKNLSHEQERARVEILNQGELESNSIVSAAKEKAGRLATSTKDLLEGESRSAQAHFRSALVAKAVELSKVRFQTGELVARQSHYVDAAIDRAKKLVR
jgi:F0F1-type ATP synthase membrane subunit b/b'